MVSQNLIERYLIDHLEYEYNKFKISVRASVALTKLAKHSDADQSFR